MNWLSGWGKRVQFTVDKNDIDANLTHFAVLVHLSAACGKDAAYDLSCVFDELELDANRKKIAITKADGTTQLYVEIEKWDDASEEAWLWVSKSDWVVLAAKNTPLVIYYDKTHTDNDTYVGDTNSTPAENVWDSNFKAVYHMRNGADNQHIYDSTSNNKDGTKGSASNPNEIAAKINSGQDFDAAQEYILIGSQDISSVMTIEAWAKPDGGAISRAVATIIEERGTYNDWWLRLDYGKPKSILWESDETAIGTDPTSETALSADTYYYIVHLADGSNLYCYINNTQYGTAPVYDGTIHNTATSGYIGKDVGGIDRYWSRQLDEIRISDINRSAAWIKATYETERDDLLDWGSEETAPTALEYGFCV